MEDWLQTVPRSGRGCPISTRCQIWHKYPVSPYFAKSEPLKYAKARRGPQEMALPLPRTATPHWRIWTAPFGQDDTRPSALMRSLALARASPAFARLASGRVSSC